MDVLLLTPSFSPIVGGTERVVENLALKLNEIGVHADVMTFNMNEKYKPLWRDEVKQNGFKLFRMSAINPLPKMRINPLRLLSGANLIPNPRFVERLKKYDVLHFHDDVDLSFSISSWFVKKPKIFQCHTLTATYPWYKSNYFPRKILNHAANSYICVSNSGKMLLSDLGVAKSKIKILYNGVDPQKFKPSSDEKIENSILFTGRLIQAKGLHVLLEALNYLDLPVSLKVAGPKEDSQYVSKLFGPGNKQRRGIHEVELLGRVNGDDLTKRYQQASIFINPALKEEFGIVNLEAASCGTPIIASKVGGIKEFVKNDINGLTVPPNDPVKLAYAIRYLLENKDLREKYGKNARRIVEEHFSWEKVARNAVKIYEEAIHQKK